MTTTMDLPHYDVIIIGAGLSGICAAYHLKKRCPDKTFLLLEGRERIGGGCCVVSLLSCLVVWCEPLRGIARRWYPCSWEHSWLYSLISSVPIPCLLLSLHHECEYGINDVCVSLCLQALGTCFNTLAFAAIVTCTPWDTASSRGKWWIVGWRPSSS